jgi:hypothetical protein
VDRWVVIVPRSREREGRIDREGLWRGGRREDRVDGGRRIIEIVPMETRVGMMGAIFEVERTENQMVVGGVGRGVVVEGRVKVQEIVVRDNGRRGGGTAGDGG